MCFLRVTSGLVLILTRTAQFYIILFFRTLLSSNGYWLYLLGTKQLICGILHISISLWCFCPRIIFTKKRIGQVTLDLLYIRFTYYTKGNQQGFSRLSNCFSLRCLGPWMNHLPPVWWPTFRSSILIVNWWTFDMVERDFSLDFLPLFIVYTSPKSYLLLSSQINLLSNSCSY